MSQSMPLLPSLGRESGSRPPTSDLARVDEEKPLEFDSRPRKAKSSSNGFQGLVLPPATWSQEDRFQEFLARQVNSSQEVRLAQAMFQRDALDKIRAASASVKLQGVESFKQLLHHRCGTITAAWRQLLDPSSKGKVSFVDFCQCCRDVGFQRKMKQLWAELDTEHQGWITLDQLDPESAQLLRDFRRAARAKHGGLLNAWYYFDSNKNHRVDMDEFIQACKNMGFKGNARKLFECLKIDVARKFLSIQDFDEKSMQCLYRGDSSMMTVKKEQSVKIPNKMRETDSGFTMPPIEDGLRSPDKVQFAESSEKAMMSRSLPNFNMNDDTPKRHEGNLNYRWTMELSKQQRRRLQAKRKKEEALDCGMKNLAGLKRELISRFGSIYAAWRQELDLDGKNRVSFQELCRALRNLGYGGKFKDLWNELDQDKDGFVKLPDLDSKFHEEITSYQALALKKHPHMLAVWSNSLDTTGSGRVQEATFVKHCKDIGWSGDAHMLFQNLKEDRNRTFMVLSDFDAKAWHAHQSGDTEMLTVSPQSAAQFNKLDFNQRQEQCFSVRFARMKSKMDRSEMEKVKSESKSRDKGAMNVSALKTLLLRRFGTMPAAWKHGLDVHCIGRLPFGEFCNAMRRIGFCGEMKRTFSELDTGDKGHVTLKDFDSEAHDILTEFRGLLLNRYGTYIKGWKAMDRNGTGVLEEHEIAPACQRIGYTKDPVKLFRYLVSGPGKNRITMADIDPAAMDAYWRGDLEAMSPMDKAKANLAAKRRAGQSEKDARMEATDWPTLKRALIRKHGTITSAWRLGLDANGNGKVSFIEFGKHVRNLGFQGDIKSIFRELDSNDDGIISFNEVDPDWYGKISQFHRLLHTKHRTYDSAWAHLDVNRQYVVEVDQFVQFCKDLGYKEDARALFKQLLQSPNYKQLTITDLEIKTAIVQGNKDDPNASLKVAHSEESLMSDADRAKMYLEKRHALEKAERDQLVGSKNWQALKEQLIRKYGTITAAWRHGLDWSNNGVLSFTQFSQMCRDNAFIGDIREAFREADADDSGIITFNEVDREWYEHLQDFHHCLLSKHSTVARAWQSALDINSNNMCEIQEFEKACKNIGYGGSPKALFRQLLKSHGTHLTFEDFDVEETLVTKGERAEAVALSPKSPGIFPRPTRSPRT
jgi:Ca2+-binding EF-hand superfamily protein